MQTKKILIALLLSFVFIPKGISQNASQITNLNTDEMIPLDFTGTKPKISIKSNVFIANSNSFTFDTGGGMPGIYVPYESLTIENQLNVDKKVVEKTTLKGKYYIRWKRINIQIDKSNSNSTPFSIDIMCNVYKKGQINLNNANDAILGFIVGATPTPNSGTFIEKLTEAYSVNDKTGFGIYTNAPGATKDINKSWGDLKAYLKIGPINNMDSYSEIKWAYNEDSYKNMIIPGFQLNLNDGNNNYTSNDLITTLDTGHDFLSTRLKQDPQNSPNFQRYFWASPWHAPHGKWMIEGLKVSVRFIDKKNTISSYTFPSIDKNRQGGTYHPNSVIISDYDNNKMPEPYKDVKGIPIVDKPQNRMFLGNTVHFYCPLVYWDISGAKFGMAFSNNPANEWPTYADNAKSKGQFRSPSINVQNVKVPAGKNRLLTVAVASGHSVFHGASFNGKAMKLQKVVPLPGGNLALYTLPLGSNNNSETGNVVANGIFLNTIGVQSFSNIDQTNPFDKLISSNKLNPVGTASLSTNLDDTGLVCDFIAAFGNTPEITTEGNRQLRTFYNNKGDHNPGQKMTISSSYKVGNGTLEMKWKIQPAAAYAQIIMKLNRKD